MNDTQFSTLLRAAIVPQIADLIIKEYSVTDVEATKMFYNSRTYELLSREETKVWHFSPLTLYNIWKTERETGEIVLPEEAL